MYCSEFEVQVPHIEEGYGEWSVTALHWDLPSTILAVSLSAASTENILGVVQLYYRDNYHWYLKQSWSGEGM